VNLVVLTDNEQGVCPVRGEAVYGPVPAGHYRAKMGAVVWLV
jgi:hypothetical protein